MAVVKKATPVAATKSKRYEVGYTFPVMAKVVSVNKSDEFPIKVVVLLETDDDEDEAELDFTRDELEKFELSQNPAAKKDILQDQLAFLKSEVARITKEIAAIK